MYNSTLVVILQPRKKKAYVRLTQDYDALDVANRIGAAAGTGSTG